jgi:tRNA-dihydrouridine synthase
VPVVANGDSRSLSAIDMLKDRTGASGVMLGRGAARAPWLFSALSNRERRERLGDLPESGELLGIVSTQLDLLSRILRNSDRLYRLMRGKLVYYFHGFPGAADLRRRCARVKSREEVLLLCELAEKQFDLLREQRQWELPEAE